MKGLNLVKTIALIDIFEGGHHEAFAILFCKHLLGLGYRVVLFFPGNEETFRQEVAADGSAADRFQFISVKITIPRINFPRAYKDAINTMVLWLKTRKFIRRHEKKTGVRFDEVFFCWVDHHLANYLPHQVVDILFPYRWSGLFFHPWYLFENPGPLISFSSRDSVLLSGKCRGVAIHDEFLAEQLQIRIKKPVVVFPEIADGRPPQTDMPLARQLREIAGGRMIVGLIGLSRRKGVMNLIRLVKVADPSRFFFLLAGNIPAHEYHDDEIIEINSVIGSNSNILHHPHYLKEGPEINAVICTCDILFLVYENFRSSSNYNTKAAIFKKPVLATNRYWIGKVTEKYKLGITVPEGNTNEMLSGLEALSELIRSKTFQPDYEGYLRVHGEDRLDDAFRDLLSK